jgi:hypothetical protein
MGSGRCPAGCRPGGRPVALTSAAHAGRVALFWPARGRASLDGREWLKSGVCGARSSGALLARGQDGSEHRRIHGQGSGRSGRGSGRGRDGPAQAVGDDRGDRRRRDRPGRWPVRHHRRGLPGDGAYVARWPARVWAIEGCAGIGGHVASRSSTTLSWRCCGSSSTGAAPWARTTRGWSASCTSCCCSSSQV